MSELYQCIFRNDGCDYHAFISADSDDDLFAKIDEFGNPYDCEIYPLNNLSMCVKVERYVDAHDANGKPLISKEISELEIGEVMYGEIDDQEGELFGFCANPDGRMFLKDEKK